MLRFVCSIVLAVVFLASCGQKGPLVLPEEARRKQTPPPAYDVPPTEGRGQ